MTSYDSYSKTSYGAQGGEAGGGFFSGSQSGSQGAQGGQKGFSDESLRPVTIKQLLDLEEAYPGADFTIDNHPITQVTIVGQIRSVNPQPTNITYRLDDGTGTIDVKKWVDADKEEDAEPKYALDQYVRVWGRLKSFNQKRHVGANFVRAVDNFNEVNYHQLESLAVHLYFTKGPLASGDAQQNGAGTGDGNAANGGGMFVDQNDSSEHAQKLAHVGPNAQKMFRFLAETPGGNEGVHLNLITSSTGLTTRDVLGAADDLLQQGLVYTTVDDETWAVLDY
ncbi:Replication factor A protein 2 [Gnomoniopsis sp. IMI 355080]|nr:Replication factor A protein 2 [Gnomoniopsis sp. IMI 355080]